MKFNTEEIGGIGAAPFGFDSSTAPGQLACVMASKLVRRQVGEMRSRREGL